MRPERGKGQLARFEAERQALAVMDHPNIARVLDAGTTPEGRPYFVMELVKGTQITTFCDANRLPTRKRLELFVAVCQAIQHAHQKGVIHRDIKPSNVLVALYDDNPLPKVIDFGIAKAAGNPLTERTLHTGFGTMLGTPEYMSPEQATFNQLDIDTRSDVYSLGVLLYELLTGTTPVDKSRFKEAALLEVLRVVREEDPPRPSVKLSTAEARASIAAVRGAAPDKLAKELRGELDWIVMKSLEKDRNRRYDTAASLARDVERYLKDELVEARPPSLGYRLRKITRKNRGPVIAASLVLLTLVGGVIGTTLSMMRAWDAEEKTRAANSTIQANLLELKGLNEKANKATDEAQQNEKKATEAARETSEVLTFFTLTVLSPQKKGKVSDISLRDALIYANKKVTFYVKDQPLVQASVSDVLGTGLNALGDPRNAQVAWERSYSIRKDRLGPFHNDTRHAMINLAETYANDGKSAKAKQLIDENLALAKAHEHLGPMLNEAAHMFMLVGMEDDAIRVCRESVAWYRKPERYKDAGESLRMLGRFLMEAQRFAEAEPALRESWALYEGRPTLGPDWFRFVVVSDLGICLLGQKKFAEAEAYLLRSFEELNKCKITMPPVKEAEERVVRLYEGLGKKDEASQWRKKFESEWKKALSRQSTN